MKQYVSKIIVLLFVLVGFLFAYNIANAEEPEVSLIMTNPSVDCSHEINIVWHTKVNGTYVEYTTKDDTNFQNKKLAIPVETELDIYDGTSGANIKDNKCEVTIKDLTPDTEYMYRVGLKSMSKVHYFKTAGSNEYSFAVVSDIHTYTKLATRLSKANAIVHNMENVGDVRFVLSAGDNMAYGTNRGYWDDFTQSDFAINHMIATTPGNHDYYNSSANFLDSSYFNAYTNNPDNGCSASLNTTYYFYYGDVLFISLNSEDACTNAAARSSQREWLDKVLKENEIATYKVVYFHRGMYPGSGSNTGHASTMKGAFQDLFDKYGVDLVFGGHDHVYVRTNKIINGKTSEDSTFGTVYINLPQIGDRASAANTDMTNVAKKIGSFSGAVLVNVTESSLVYTLYDDSNNILDMGSVTNKMSAISKSKVNNNTKIKYEKDFSNMYLTIPETLFQRAYNLKVIDKDTNTEVLNIRPSYQVTEYRIMGISNYAKQKDFEVIISYRNGTTFTKDITVKNNLDYGTIDNIRIEGTTLKWNSSLDGEIVDELRIIEKDKITSIDINETSHEITLPLLEINDVVLELIAIDGETIDKFTIQYGVNPDDVVFAVPDVEVNVGEEVKIEIVNSLGIDIDYVYQFDNNYIELKDGKLYAIKDGMTTIICSNEKFSDQIVSVEILPKTVFTVTIDLNGGFFVNEDNNILVFENIKTIDDIIILHTGTGPRREGYTWSGLYLDKDCTQSVDYNKELKEDITIYAGWTEVKEEKPSGCSKASIINYLISLSMAFGVMFVVKKKH